MLYDLGLERLARSRRESGSPTSREHLQALVESGEHHPEHLCELLLEAWSGDSRGSTLEDRAWILEQLRSLGAPGLLEAAEDHLVALLRAQELSLLTSLRPLLRELLVEDPDRRGLEPHLERLGARARVAAEKGERELFHALTRYLARGLARCPRAPRGALLLLLGNYRLLRALLLQPHWERWVPPLLRSLRLALDHPLAESLLEREPDLLGEHLEGLWWSLGELASRGRSRRLGLVLEHLLWLQERFPEHRELGRSFAHLPQLLRAAPPESPWNLDRLPDRLRAELAESGEAPPFPALTGHLESLVAREEERQMVRASLRPRPRKHLAKYLHLASQFYRGDSLVAALYPAAPPHPLPLVTLYFPRGRGDGLGQIDRGPLEVALQKQGESHRLLAFHPNSGRVLSAYNLLDEVDTLPFRRSLTYSAGAYAVVLVELETLEVRGLRTHPGYLDFTGALYRGIELQLAGELRPAIRELEKALAANPRLRGAQCRLGHCFRKLARSRRDLQRAQSHYERELAAFPESADAWNGLGLLTLGQGELEAAQGLLEQAVQADPEHLAALTNLGLLCLARADRPASQQRFGEVLRAIRDLDPSSPSLEQLLSQEAGASGREWGAFLRTEP